MDLKSLTSSNLIVIDADKFLAVVLQKTRRRNARDSDGSGTLCLYSLFTS